MNRPLQVLVIEDSEDDAAIMDQVIGRVENDDLATIKNTVFKIAKKRSKVDATLSATRSAGQFTQDIGDDSGKKKKAAPIQQPQRKSETQAASSPANGDLIINEKQISRLWAKAYALNLKDKEAERKLVSDILAVYGYQHADKIKVTDYDAIIAAVEKGRVPTSDPEPSA